VFEVFDVSATAGSIAQMGWARLPGLLRPQAAAFVNRAFDRKFEKREILNGATEHTLVDLAYLARMQVLFNSPDFLTLMSQALGAQVALCKLRVYWCDSQCQELDWHDDSYSKDPRVAALRFEWSESYEGGRFHFKDLSTGEDQVLPQLSRGEAHLFRVVPGKFIHRVEKVTTGVRRSLIVFLIS
jgi:hypothetical protein